MTWKTRTRNKILVVGLLFVGICDVMVIKGWLAGRADAPAMLTALNGSGGVWAAINSLSIAWEKRNEK